MSDYYDPYREMKAFYSSDDPTEDQQFRFVEAMKYIIATAYDSVDIQMASYNLAMYYRDNKEFQLEKKYLEIGEEQGENFCKEELGFIWYYGLCGEQNLKKAFQYFKECGFERSQYMLADMYRYGRYVKQNKKISRVLLEKLFLKVESEREDPRFTVSTLFPEVALRLVQLNLEEDEDTEFDLDCLLDARDILAIRQRHRPFWGNIKTMREILETTVLMVGNEYDFIDLYDLMTFTAKEAVVSFRYKGNEKKLDIFQNAGETIYQYDNKWFHGADDFLEKARIDGKRITSVLGLITDIKTVSCKA